MTLAKSELVVVSAEDIGESDRIWFPKWLRRYAMSFGNGLMDELPVNRDAALQFSRSLLKNAVRLKRPDSMPVWYSRGEIRLLQDIDEGFDNVYLPLPIRITCPTDSPIQDARDLRQRQTEAEALH